MIFAKLIPEYDYDNQFIENLFNDKRFSSNCDRNIEPFMVIIQ